ncbi:hypothetical protein QVD17_11155 [Tagetes erecta]|uniref:Reverse transcriptase domain-containing protein n=1 Tax=Tagetes erecta TaxID=13708 RepID=A0AAD8P6Z7_TARER|nr:hypothetical protein QVD17_11155 [Tagetes erecta]
MVSHHTYAFVASRAQSWALQDHILRSCGLDGLDSDYGCALERLQTSLPDFDISGFSKKDTAPPKAQHVLASALFSRIGQSLEVRFDLSPRQKAVVACLQAPRAQDFLTVIPIEGLGQHMSPLEYRAILKYRLMIPLFPVDEPCPVCRKVCLDAFGDHAVHCKELPGFKYRHDLVRDVLCDILKRAGISAKKEAPVNFLTDPLEGRSTLRPADILVFGWTGGKHACVDLTGVSPLVALRDNGFVARQAASKAESCKIAKHEKACLENQHVFIPLAFDTFGFLATEAVNFLTRVQRVIHSNVSTPKGQGFVFSRLGFAIQKGLIGQSDQLVSSLAMNSSCGNMILGAKVDIYGLQCTDVRRRIWPLRRRKKKVATVRLGGKRQLLVKTLRRIRMKWMKMKKACSLKKLKEYYYSVLKDVIEGGGTFETYQQRLILETSFAVPVMGLSFNTYHSSTHLHS